MNTKNGYLLGEAKDRSALGMCIEGDPREVPESLTVLLHFKEQASVLWEGRVAHTWNPRTWEAFSRKLSM